MTRTYHPTAPGVGHAGPLSTHTAPPCAGCVPIEPLVMPEPEPWPGYAVMTAIQEAVERSTDQYDGSVYWTQVPDALKEAGWVLAKADHCLDVHGHECKHGVST